ncbi:capsid assembly scaffolding protein Gp46 family protein [Mycobacteroides immunogenum]|uniref:capsid assembly scaffolding protein Gp46 family protein n=1 Tax=Mycobacteroides immunogenum TaxID=83262 RepID=UPI0006BA6B41|nr:DUF4355 domain-containing protein [Mycobacteroides immunogenum]
MNVENEPVINLSGSSDDVNQILEEAFGTPNEPKVEAPKDEPKKPVKEYVAPQSQEDLDRIIADRIRRVENKYKDYDELKDRASKYDDLEAEKGSDVEKATRRYEKAEKDLADLQATIAKRDREDLVRDIGDELGLPAKLRARVQGDDETAIRADISELLDGLPAVKSAPAGPPVNAPKEKLKLSTPTDAEPEVSSDDIVKSIPRGGLSFF